MYIRLLNMMISLDDFKKVEMRVGLVTEATNVEGSEKLIRLSVDLGDEKRTIFTGVRSFGYTPDFFVNKKWLFVTNLEYRKMPSFVETPAGKMREDSQGMILAVDGTDEKPVFVQMGDDAPVGSRVR